MFSPHFLSRLSYGPGKQREVSETEIYSSLKSISKTDEMNWSLESWYSLLPVVLGWLGGVICPVLPWQKLRYTHPISNQNTSEKMKFSHSLKSKQQQKKPQNKWRFKKFLYMKVLKNEKFELLLVLIFVIMWQISGNFWAWIWSYRILEVTPQRPDLILIWRMKRQLLNWQDMSQCYCFNFWKVAFTTDLAQRSVFSSNLNYIFLRREEWEHWNFQ